jgi:hypothetical protein
MPLSTAGQGTTGPLLAGAVSLLGRCSTNMGTIVPISEIGKANKAQIAKDCR